MCTSSESYDFQCDELTGQCRCVPGVKSRDCSQCAPRHVLTAAKSCKDCNGVCTGTLASFVMMSDDCLNFEVETT